MNKDAWKHLKWEFQGGIIVMKVSTYTASGLVTGNLPSMSVSTNSLSSISKVTQRTTGRNKNQKKQLNYNPREMSAAILRAKKSQSAGRVLTQTKSKLSNLMKCKASGQYNDAEVNVAIAHAKKMVQCAQMKTQNLRQEERAKKKFENEAKADLRQEKNEEKARAARKERAQEQKSGLARMQRIQKQKSQKRELVRKKKFHRSEEQSKVNEADFNYLKQQLRNLRNPYSSSGGASTGVTLDLSAEAAQLTDAQIEQQAQQIANGMNAGTTATGSSVSQEAAVAAGGINIVV